MTVVVTHSTPSDSSFSTTGATAWDANHTLSGVGTMAGQDANAVAITGGSISGVSGLVTNVTGTAPVVSSGGATPAISMAAATTSVSGYLTSTDWNTFNGKGSGSVTSVAGTGTVNGLSLSGTVTSSGSLTFGGTLDLSSPPAIGGTAASTGRFTTVTSTVATGTAPFTVASTTAVANLSIGGNAGTVTNGVYTTDTGTVTNTMLAGSITNAKLVNSSITFGSTAQALGSTVSAISGVTIDNGVIGGTTAVAGTFTTLTGTTSTTTPIVQNSAAAAIAFKTNSATSAVTQFNINHTATAVNYVQVAGAATGTRPAISAQGSDGNVGLTYNAKGSANHFFQTGGLNSFAISNIASQVNYLQVAPTVASSAPVLSSQGSDTDIQLSLVPKGLGIVLMNQQTPAAVTATGTLTIANLLTQIITSTSAVAVALTLPTGTLSDAGVSGGTSAVNTSFDYSIINLGSAVGDVTMVAGTAHTIVGSATVAVGTSGRFRCRKTATNTFVSYRV